MLRLYRRPGSRIWYLRGTVRGRRVFETSGTPDRAQAEAHRAKREAGLFEESIFGARAVVSFSTAALSYLEFEERSERTEEYVDRLVDHFGTAKLASIDQNAAERAVSNILGNDVMAATKVRGVYGPLTAILNHAHARGWCDSPKFDLPAVTRSQTRWLTPREALALINAAAGHLRPLLQFILCTGARLSEALDLEWNDVDLPAALAHFRGTKNGGDRAATLPPSAIITLANLPGREIDRGIFVKEGPVFLRDDGEPYVDRERLQGGQIKTAWRGACRRAGIVRPALDVNGKPKLDARCMPAMEPDATPHDLRHTWATWFYAITKDILLLKSEGGWKSISMVERYAHLMPRALVPEIATVWGSTHPRIGRLPGANSVHAPPFDTKTA